MATCGIEKKNPNVDWSDAKSGRALHYVFKVGNRQNTIDFYRNVLHMKVLRHEEFEEGCKATCNGPYNGRWSKTMIGYGSENENFVIELTYNYEIGSYRLGNDFFGLFIESDELLQTVKASGKYEIRPCGRLQVTDPDGHRFMISGGYNGYRVSKVAIHVSDLEKSIDYWKNLLGMVLIDKNNEKKQARLSYGSSQCALELRQLISGSLDRGTGFGRIAFSYPGSKLDSIQQEIKSKGCTVLKELVTLETPNKADVQVVILADPNEHEICFVGDEGFRELSQIDQNADQALTESMRNDDSEKWGKRQG